MTFQELLSEISKLRCEETRTHTEEYLEIVVSKELLPKFEELLKTFFGSPLKPEGKNPSWEAKDHSKPYGGINQNQTMYFRKGEQGHEMALLWPWGSGVFITIKIIQEKSKRS